MNTRMTFWMDQMITNRLTKPDLARSALLTQRSGANNDGSAL
jgi:hypothetical protein